VAAATMGSSLRAKPARWEFLWFMSLSEGRNHVLGDTRCVFSRMSNVGGLRRLLCPFGAARGLQIVCNPPLLP